MTVIRKNEHWFDQINFWSDKERLLAIGWADDEGRKEEFEIADDEHLIGCELDVLNNNFVGVTWLKMKWK